MSEDETRGNVPDDPSAQVRAYYRALDNHDYTLLEGLLAPSFVHDRPDMTLEGRSEFVRFMRSDRPMTDTSHPIDALYRESAGDEIVARGRLLAADGTLLATFLDVFSFTDDRVARIQTFTG
jgi:ketosteroid isomerase-like protein